MQVGEIAAAVDVELAVDKPSPCARPFHRRGPDRDCAGRNLREMGALGLLHYAKACSDVQRRFG